MIKAYAFEVLLAIDQLANALIGGFADETISSRFGKNWLNGGWTSKVWWPRWWIYHCLDAIEHDEGHPLKPDALPGFPPSPG